LIDTKKQISELEDQLQKLSQEELTNSYALTEQLENEQMRLKAADYLKRTEKSALMRFWAPLRDLERLKKEVADVTSERCSFKVLHNPVDAPVLQDNPEILRPFESFTRLFSTPKYGRVDPTILTAPTLVLFFGFMLSDAIYGLILVLIASYLKRKYAKVLKVSDFMKVIQWCGAATIIFGIVSGGFFGDFLSRYIFGLDNAQALAPFVLIDPLYKSNAITLLIIAVAVGFAHTVAGNIIGFVDNLQSRKPRDAITQNLSWLLILAGAFLALFSDPVLASTPATLGLILLLLGAGPISLMDLPGLLGRIMSYSRLLALNLTTPGMGLAFNFLASMLWGIPIVGPILAGIAFIISHTIILLLNALGSFVHSLRLHYVEYYGTFYGGGGLAYTPFAQKCKYTKIR
jgi:V/A-type H+-transporting ATPase subunit I